MKAWQIVSKGEFRLVEKDGTVDSGEVKVKVNKAALACTDLELYKGQGNAMFPIVPVMSAVGQISEGSELAGLQKGERVVLYPYEMDPDTTYNKKRVLAPDVKIMGLDTDGFLCDFVTVPHEKAYILPEGVSDSAALFTEYIALGIKVIEALHVEKGQYITILGANTIGNIIAQLALYYQIVPVLIDTDQSKLDLAQSYGVYYTVNPTSANVGDRIKEITGGEMAEYCVYEIRGGMSPNYATAITKETGTVVVVGHHLENETVNFNLCDVLEKQLSVVGVKNGYGEFYSAINLLANHAVKTDGLVDVEIEFEDVPRKFQELAEVETRIPYQKVVVKC